LVPGAPLTWWINGGLTHLDDMALLCEFHHARVHAEMWRGRIGADGHPEYIPPGWVDAHRTPRRNTYWRDMRELNLGYDGLEGIPRQRSGPGAEPEPRPHPRAPDDDADWTAVHSDPAP
jgi:hypothetical protein